MRNVHGIKAKKNNSAKYNMLPLTFLSFILKIKYGVEQQQYPYPHLWKGNCSMYQEWLRWKEVTISCFIL